MSEVQALIEWRLDDRIATVAFNRPDVLNAVNTEVWEHLVDIFAEIDGSREVRCVILKGNGRAFCVGADQKERPEMSLDEIRRRRRVSPVALAAIRNCSHPVIAQVHGYALGSGLEMALHCDFGVVAEGTVLGLIETTRAAIPAAGGTQLLPRLLGPARAKELIFTGRRITGEQAFEWGLFNYIVPPGDLDRTVRGLAEEIVAAAPIAVTQAKRAINLSMDLDIENGIQAEAALYERVLTTEDRLEALRAYKERRPADFRGQ